MYLPYNQRLKYLTIITLTSFFLLLGCSSSRVTKYSTLLQNEPLNNSFHGLVVLDTERDEVIYNTNGDRYFTPASNLKIVTFFTGLVLLPKNIPSLKYHVQNDTLFAEGTGDPSALHPYFEDSTAINFLNSFKNVSLYLKNSAEDKYGPGWAWEDYDTYFSPEKSTFPLYGNVVTISKPDSLNVSPSFFKENVILIEESKQRDEFINHFFISPSEKDTLEVPFITSDLLTKHLLENNLKKNISLIDSFPAGDKKILYGIETDSIYKLMLHKSDNFLAEQLLMAASSMLSDTLSTKTVITHMLENDLADLEHQPRWVDGSGLSRYNLFTPKSFVQILQKIYTKVPGKRLFQLFPSWGALGTITKWENPNTKPYIFAKSGYVGNNYNLSGYLKTKSGKLLIFSFMNNHFTIPTSQIRLEIATVLKDLHENY
ncbi:D-alanyl-D-alanine carboxypeptidase [Flagellimonas eckloniae]|uniref:D-alanyl-D-alanine carboxypeptidase n=1 Tax=Flagellimonas eckloniae TaxID=346185 RepID=A0A0Q1H5A2_9FLAO|nr:D-alanyl-D-alanine carboxypeptidase [Allomuricauda eckloniae]KQC28711.1 D-alanyl-D-alanine carboxypeptidase [Allomuricauda eckloniae]